ncbi:hypothetical protein QL285_037008 [Trifolium repens]|nr:hypothetical protein QL285_037008 [Trifolium repens]
MPTSHQPSCCSLQPDYTTPSLNPEENRFVLSKKYLPPIVLGLLEQSYKSLHHLRTPECLPYSRRKMLAFNLALEFRQVPQAATSNSLFLIGTVQTLSY